MRTNLNDLHLVLLSTAAARDTASLLPFPTSVSGEPARIAKAVSELMRRSLVEETPTKDHMLRWRDDGGDSIGLVITDKGRTAIGAIEGAPSETESKASDTGVVPQPPPLSNKTSLVVGLLEREDGASITDLIDATGWLAHTTRAALTGLRKKGHDVQRFAHAAGSRYRIRKAG